MPRQRNIPSLTHHSASGRAVVRLSGKDHYCGAWDARRDRATPEARAAYARLVSQWLARGGHDQAPLEPEPFEDVGQLAAAYWTHVRMTYRKHGRETSEVTAQKIALRYLLDLFRTCPLADFGPLKLRAVRDAMVRDNLARKSINRHVGRIRQAFAWAAENELIDPMQPRRLECVKGLRKGQGGCEQRRRPVLDWDRVQAVQPHAPSGVWAMVQLQWLTGMRSGEVLQMTAGAIDRTGEVWLYRPAQHKTEHRDKERVIAIGPKAQAVLATWMPEDPDEPLFQPARSEQARNVRRREDRVLPRWPSHDPDYRRRRRGRGGRRRRPGTRYTKDSYRRAVQRAIVRSAAQEWQAEHGQDSHLSPAFRGFLASAPKRRTAAEVAAWRRAHGGEAAMYDEAFAADLAGRMWHPHELRHAFATRARSSFENWDPVRAALGHSSAEVTLEYARLEIRKAADVARRIG